MGKPSGRLGRLLAILGASTALGGAGLGVTAVSAVSVQARMEHAGVAYRFLAGAGRADTTPPLAGTAAGNAADQEFAPGFADCSATTFPSAGRFALQEPFDDLNGDGLWDAGVNLNNGPDGKKPDPWCDANGNGNWDGIYQDNDFGPATGVNDPLDARAFAISDGHDTPVVYVSVDVIGLFDYYTEQARADLLNTYHVNAELVVSADHNESSPDTLGLYGDLQTPLGVGLRSGIDEYYMAFLDDRIAQAAAEAVHNLQPANLYANQIVGHIPDGWSGNEYPLYKGLQQRISDQFPTSVALPNDDRVAAVDPKLGVLQARRPDGTAIFTVINIAAHNQEMGNSGAQLSADWPGAMEHYYDGHSAGMAIFLVGDNGSEEDPETDPVVIPKGSENHTSTAEQYKQVLATGRQFAIDALGAAADAVELTPGKVSLTRIQFCVPQQNNGFAILAATGVFGERQAYICNSQNQPTAPVPNSSGRLPTEGTEFRTFVGVSDIGPDFQFLDIPGEAFPALIMGSPFSQDTESCPRPNPAVPMWHANAVFRFPVGLADDEIGYLIPAWGFASETPGLFNNDTCSQDEHGHGHKLESESVGPTGANDVANYLAGLLDHQPDPTAHIVLGRYVLANGSLSSWPTHAVGVLTAPSGTTTLTRTGGLLIGDPSVKAFGSRQVDVRALFMDYDGQPQPRPDVTTRGMIVLGSNGCVVARYYVNVFPDLSGLANAGSAVSAPSQLPKVACRVLESGNIPELQPGAAAAAGLPTHAFSCPRPSGRLTQLMLGPVRLGMTRAQARSKFARHSTRGRRYMDFFCPAHGGIRVGYPSPILLRTLPAEERARIQGRVIIALTANRHYALRGVHPGTRLTVVARRLDVGRGFHIGLNWWYLTPNGSSRGVLKVRQGVIEEVGIANLSLTHGREAAARFLSSFG